MSNLTKKVKRVLELAKEQGVKNLTEAEVEAVVSANPNRYAPTHLKLILAQRELAEREGFSQVQASAHAADNAWNKQNFEDDEDLDDDFDDDFEDEDDDWDTYDFGDQDDDDDWDDDDWDDEEDDDDWDNEEDQYGEPVTVRVSKWNWRDHVYEEKEYEIVPEARWMYEGLDDSPIPKGYIRVLRPKFDKGGFAGYRYELIEPDDYDEDRIDYEVYD